MDWKNIIIIVFAAIMAGVFAPMVTPTIMRWLKKMRIFKLKNSEND